jgi:signal transduction histidine kinase
MKVFHKKNGAIVQLIGKKKMMEWPVELPLIFIEYIRNSKLETYNDKKVEKEISNYLDEVLEEVAIPRLIEVLEGDDNEEIIDALKRIEKIANDNLDMTRPIKPYLEDLMNNKNKEIKELADNILELFRKEARRKELNKRRKVMKEKEDLFLEGKINGEEYAKARRKYLNFRDNR